MLKIHSFCFNPFQENTYILYNEQKESIIIDPGMYTSVEFDQFYQFIEDNSLQPKLLLNTHCHLDHVFGNNAICDRYQLTAHFHPNEQMIIDRLPDVGAKWGIPTEAFTGPVKYLQDKDIIELGEDKFQALLTPGHSPGSLCFYNAAQSILIGGDIIFMDGVGRTDLPASNPLDLIKSIHETILPLPEQTTIYSGHGPATSLRREKLHNPYLLHLMK